MCDSASSAIRGPERESIVALLFLSIDRYTLITAADTKASARRHFLLESMLISEDDKRERQTHFGRWENDDDVFSKVHESCERNSRSCAYRMSRTELEAVD